MIFSIVVVVLSVVFDKTTNMLVESRTKSGVEIGYSVIESFYNQYKDGKMGEEEAKQQAIETVRNLRYMGSEYFWVNDYSPKMIMHPFSTQLEGQDLSEIKDPDGLKLFVEMTNVVKEKGEGVVYYKWQKPNEPIPQPKISYVKGFKEWNMIVGSGVLCR